MNEKTTIKALEAQIRQLRQERDELQRFASESRALLNASMDAVFLTAPDGRIFSANQAACTLFQMTEAELIAGGRSVIYSENATNLAAALEERKATGRFRGEVTHKKKDGTLFPAEVSSVIYTNPEGQERTCTIIRDSSEEKLRRSILRETLEKYKILFDSFPQGITVADNDGNIVETNTAAEQLLGISKDYHETLTIYDSKWHIIRPDGSDMPPEEWASVIAFKEQRVVNNCEMGIVNPGGDVAWLNVAATPLSVDGYGVVVTYHDITEKRLTELALFDSQHRNRILLETIPDLMFVLSRDGCILDFQAHDSSELILEPDKVVGSVIADYMPIEIHSELLNCVANALDTQCLQTLEYQLPVKKGQQTYEARITPFSENSVLAIARNITERKEAEEDLKKYRNIVSSTLDAIAFIDKEYRYTIVNDAYEKFSEVNREHFVGQTVYEYLGEDIFQRFVKPNFDRCLQGEVINYQQWFEYPTMGRRFVDVSYFPYRDTSDQIAGVVANTRDITERKLAEDALKRSEERYQAIIHVSPMAIFLIRNGHYHYANPAARKAFGFTADTNLSEISIDQTIAPELVPQVQKRIMATEAGQVNPPMELILIRPDGSRATMESLSLPIQLDDGLAMLVMGVDISERKKSADLLRARLRLSEASTSLTLRALMTMVLDEAEALTKSEIGFFHTYDEDTKAILLQAWSTATKNTFCKAEGVDLHYNLDVAGVWAEAIRQRQVVVHNDFSLLPHHNAMPEGHADVLREIVVPVFRNERLVAVLGVGNKAGEYDEKDIELVSSMADLAWDITIRKQAEDALKASLAEKEVLIREVHHRVKNNLAAIVGLFNLQRQNIKDQHALTALTELSNRIQAMSLVHEKLYRSESLARINFQDYLKSLISHLRTLYGSRDIDCRIEAQGVELPLDMAVPCGMIVSELVTNALKYAFPADWRPVSAEKRQIFVQLACLNETFTLSVEDNGGGLPDTFDWNSANTLGLILTKMLGEHQLGGHFTLIKSPGVRFTLSFPSSQKRKANA